MKLLKNLGGIMKTYSLFIKFLISLILLLVLPVSIIETISNYEILKYSEDEISNYGIGKLKVAENILIQLKETVFNDSVKISVNATINGLSNYNNSIDMTDGNNLLYVTHILDTLAELPKINNKYKSIYLYLDNFNYAFTSDYDFIKKDMLPDTGWLKYYDDYKKNKTALSMLNARIPSNNSNGRKNNSVDEFVVSCIYPLTPYTTNINGALVINLKERAINNLINSSNKDTEGYIFIVNQDGEIISHPNIELVGTNIFKNEYLKNVTDSKLQQGHLISNVDKNKSLVSYYKSKFNNWTFIGIFPIDALTSKANIVRLNTIYIYLVLIVLGIVAAYIISRKMYSPVEKLIKDIKAEKGMDFTGDEDEMSIISRTFATLIKQDKNLFDMLEKNKKEVKETYLKELLSGSVAEETNKNIVGDNFIYNSYVCVVISIDKYNTFTKIYSREQQYYMKNLISQVTDEVLKSNFPAVSCSLSGGEVTVIVNVADNLHDIQLSLKQHFSKIQQELAKIMENSFSASIGTVHRGTQGITMSYFEAQAALKQKLKLGYGNIILWTEGFADDDYYYPVKIEELLLNYLRIPSFTEVQVVLNKLIDDLISRSNLSSENILQIFSQIVGNTVIKLLLEEHINIYDIFGVEYNIFKELASRENIYEIRDLLEEVYYRIIQHCEKLKRCDKKYMKEIIGYISQNYNRDISINDVSEYVGLSYSHVRKIFKEEIGENIIEFINNIRINEAKKLLANMDINIKDIAMNLGYNNVQSFTRFFKKNEGITPGEYRSNL